ncbi:hypothetical protein EDD15DRAFT_2247261 [Pisolithus albus]|nr:hypothetical protein EDD15DRAFT_2247261 [Pisolithus albus]
MATVNMCGSKDLLRRLHRRCQDVPCRLPVAGHFTRFIMALHMGQLPVGMAPGYVLSGSATGEEHRRRIDRCASFQHPDEVELQQWYINRGQFDFVIADGMMVNELTRGSDIWARVQAGAKNDTSRLSGETTTDPWWMHIDGGRRGETRVR